MPLYLSYPAWIQPKIIPGLPFHWYGAMYLVAFAITYALFRYQIKKDQINFSQDDTMTMFVWVVVAALLMARIFATIIYDSTGKFLRKPWLVFWPFDENMRFVGFQGMSYFGGLVGALSGAFLWSRRYRQNPLKWGDLIVHGFPLGYSFIRLGNFINGELYGRITASPLGMIFPHARRISVENPRAREIIETLAFHIDEGQAAVNLPRHPSQLYEAFAEGVLLWVIMWYIIRPRRKFDGFSIAIYVMGYGIVRFVAEFFRELDTWFDFYTALNLSLGQIFSLLAIFGGGAALLVLHQKHKRRPSVETYENPE